MWTLTPFSVIHALKEGKGKEGTTDGTEQIMYEDAHIDLSTTLSLGSLMGASPFQGNGFCFAGLGKL